MRTAAVAVTAFASLLAATAVAHAQPALVEPIDERTMASDFTEARVGLEARSGRAPTSPPPSRASASTSAAGTSACAPASRPPSPSALGRPRSDHRRRLRLVSRPAHLTLRHSPMDALTDGCVGWSRRRPGAAKPPMFPGRALDTPPTPR